MTTIALSNGAFVVTDTGAPFTLNTGGRRPQNWDAGRNDQVLGIRDAVPGEGGKYAILVSTTARNGTVTYTEFLVSATGVVERRGEVLTLAEVGDIQGSYFAVGMGAPLAVVDMTLVDVASASSVAGIDLGLAQGRFTITDSTGTNSGTVNLSDSRGNEWQAPSGATIIGVRELSGGNGYALLLEETDRRGNVSYSEVNFSAAGVAARSATALTEAQKASLETAYGIGSTAPAPVMLDLDSPGDTDIGTVTYPATGQVQYVIDADGIVGGATILILDNRGNEWSPGRDKIVAIRDLPLSNAGFEILLSDDRGQISKLAIAEDGTAARSPTVLRDYDLVRESIRFDSDLTGKGFNALNPDKVAEVINDPETVRADAGKVSVVLSEGGGYFVKKAATAPEEGDVVDRLWENGNNGPTVPLLLTSDGSAWAPTNASAGTVPIGARELPGGGFAVLSLRVSDTGRETYREQDFLANGEADGRDRAVDAVALEGLYLQDFNGDNVIDIREATYVTPLANLVLTEDLVLRARFDQIDDVTITGGEGARIELYGVEQGNDLGQLTLPYSFAEPGVYVVDPQTGIVERTYADLTEPPINLRGGDDYIDPAEIDGQFWYVGAGTYTEGNAGASFQVNIRDTGEEGYSDLVFRGANYLIEGASEERGAETILQTNFAGRTFGAGEQQAQPITVAGFRFEGPATATATGFDQGSASGTFGLLGLGVGSVIENNVFVGWRGPFDSGADMPTIKGNLFLDSRGGIVLSGKNGDLATGGLIENNVFQNVGGGISLARAGDASEGKALIIKDNVISAVEMTWTVNGVDQAREGIAISVGATRSSNTIENWLQDVQILNNDLSGSNIGVVISAPHANATLIDTGNPAFYAGFTITGNDFGATPVINLSDVVFEFGANKVLGVDYEAMIVGGTGADTITSTDKDEVLIGGAEDDVFIFSGSDIGNDVITDFEGTIPDEGDVIDLAFYAGLNFGALNIAEANGNSVITADAFDGSITLLGVTGLAEDDFMFANLMV